MFVKKNIFCIVTPSYRIFVKNSRNLDRDFRLRFFVAKKKAKSAGSVLKIEKSSGKDALAT
jgi:hypothetical protein